MLSQETLLEETEIFLKSRICEAASALSPDFDSLAPFGELGIDSFRVLKITKSLETDFGALPKTLFFEHFNVSELARYFVDKHEQKLIAKFSKTVAPRAAAKPVPVPATLSQPSHPLPCVPAQAQPLRLLERDLEKYPELAEQVRSLFQNHKNDGGVSRGTRNIAPNLFVSSERRGYFNYALSKDALLAYAFTGPRDHFPTAARELAHYCAGKKFQLNLFVDEAIDSIGDIRVSATPFGALQRIVGLQDFTLEGSAMRRLRYQVSRFEKAGVCRTEEYRCGTSADIDRSIASVIDTWCASKPMVNPLIHIVKEEILAGSLDAQHRLFLTYLDDVLQNVILLTPLSAALNGYLMDLEFYGPQMPLGGLEFAIVKIIEQLVAEGRGMLSLGGTYGCRLESCANADPEIDRVLDDLHRQNIFNDAGNLQFKNKFRPVNRTIYLCRPAGCGNAENISDIIMMIADPSNMQTPDTENHNVDEVVGPTVDPSPSPGSAAPTAIEDNARARILADFGFNPLNIPAEQVEIDLKTDSWAQLKTAFVEKHTRHLRSQLQLSANVTESLRSVFPFKHFVLTTAGRTAEHLLCKAWPKKGVVLQNLLFPSGIYHQIDKGFTPLELPRPEVFHLQSSDAYKADLDWQALQEQVTRQGEQIAFVCIEVTNNASGGHPLSTRHLRQVKELLARHSIPLVIDGTRILENARYLIEHDAEHAGKSLWDVAREILSLADAVVASLCKDFCVDKGGLIATNDSALFGTLQSLQREEGGALDVIDKKVIALSLRSPEQIEAQVVRRMNAVKSVWQALKAARVPVVEPAGGHCVLIDVKQMGEFSELAHPVASFLAWLYLNTGVRAGAHSAGMQKNSTINGLVRLAIPVGLKDDQVVELIERLTHACNDKRNIPDLIPAGGTPESFGEVGANYRLGRWHRLAACPVAKTPVAQTEPPSNDVAKPAELVRSTDQKTQALDIAIVGMAGRYPGAKNLDELWRNLEQGKDCVGDIPEERLARRSHARRYRGGFLSDVDKFDSLFFNISPREAELLDPQDRLFLETAWQAIEDAGYYPEILAGESAPRNIGVFVGAVWTMYQIAGVEQKWAGNNVNPNSFLWSIANRVSYWMNLTGPSLTVDTACSSSLTALHLACEAVQRGDCSAAIVGGVNLDLHQHKFDINDSGGALSRDGVCRSFGAGANGYVAGEGVGAILIKPLARAIADQDNIYGVIKSAVVNHGGRTSGYTVPSPKAQSELIQAALDRAGVDAGSIGYIEAHGTGTELGDPIEIAGLTSAFAASSVPKQSCPIGSVKTNIGHLEAAAGIVSVCKVLLQMQHRKLAPSLHSYEPNALIDFNNSPFQVVQDLQDWEQKEIDGRKLPLRAGISSFGAGGANAHVIIEQHQPTVKLEQEQSGARIFPLSARSEEQLLDMASRLRSWLDQDASHRPGLDNIAFTLQRGRKSFDHRLAIIASTREALVEKLNLFLSSKSDKDVLSGHARNAEGITKLLSRREKEQLIEMLSHSGDAHRLARLWIDGLINDLALADSQGCRRASLPTYPFADKRHWIGSDAAQSIRPSGPVVAGPHPLIDSNESTFQQQLFKKTFQAREFFLADHVVSGIPTLPGTAYLDLARKAGEIAAGRKVRKISSVIWMSPLTAEAAAPTEAFIELKPVIDPKGEAVAFEVFSKAADGTKRVYCQGRLSYAGVSQSAPEPEYIDLGAIRARCQQVFEGKEIYPLFQSLGMHYGPSFQLLQEVRKNETELLGALQLPRARIGDFQDFVLHPSLLDAAMQAGVVGQLSAASGEMMVPYSIGEVEILHPLTQTCYSYVCKVANESSSSRLSKQSVLIVDESGKILARIRDSVGVPIGNVHGNATQSNSASDDGLATLHYTPVWEDVPLPPASGDIDSIVLFDTDERARDAFLKSGSAIGRRAVLVLPGERYEELADHTYRIDPRERRDYARLFETLGCNGCAVENICYGWPASFRPEQSTIDDALERGVYAFLYLCQALIEQKPAGRVQLIYSYFVDADGPQPHNEAMSGFVKALRLEHSKVHAKVVALRQDRADVDGVLSALLAELRPETAEAVTVRYDGPVRQVRKLERFDLGGDSRPGVLKENGVYLITGGAGGLGLIFAELLAAKFKAKLALTGRSELSGQGHREIERLEKLGAEVFYTPADVSKHDDAQRVIAQTRSRFGRIDGVIHSAGVLRDSYLKKKTRDEMSAVFAPKIHGTLHLDELTRSDALDLFVTFSSLAAVGGNVGQCDYAFANHFMDSFAARREGLRASGLRSGKTLSLNWSLWANGGMKLDAQTELFFRKNLGIKPMSKAVGLDAFLRGLSSSLPQLAVLEGVQAKVEQAWGLARKQASTPAAAPASAVAHAGGVDLTDAVTQELSKLVVELLKLSASDLSPEAILLDLGFDSIGLSSLANAINARYGLEINPVLFFEHASIAAIARHLAADHADAVRKAHDGGSSHPATAPVPAQAQTQIEAAPLIAFNKGWPVSADGNSLSREHRFVNEPIAIVGIAGSMPQSENLDEFWDHLKNARNLVTEIPRDRWVWEEHDGDPVKEVNKSNSRWGGFMKEIDKFDPLFFGIVPREAEMMDPQQRIFLQTVYHAIEDSGHKVSDLSGTKTALYVGVSAKDYTDVLATHQMALDGYSASGNSHSILANRVSFLLNLRGPSAPIDTACSSSLIALHRAIESIHTGSSDMAIVGGVQVMLTPVGHISLSSAGMLSPDGQCKTFDKSANGYVRGEGAGAIFIKPLSKAIADGNPIYAVIKSTSENHGGKVTVLTAPNPSAQAELLSEAYEKAQIDPTTVGYIECHGTGTSLGDPIEIQALKKSFGDLYKKHRKAPAAEPHCGLSSVKTNIGHLEPAAGIASLLKVLLAMKHRQIPALLHFDTLNPYIDLTGSPFYIVDKTRDWLPIRGADGTSLPRRAGVSSFGWGGANAHVVLEEYLPREAALASRTVEPQLVVLSAKSVDRLRAYVESMLAHVEQHHIDLSDFAYTLQVGRDALEERLAVIVGSIEKLRRKLRAWLKDETQIDGLYRGRVSRGKDVGAEPDSNNLNAWASAWTKGAAVDWRLLHAGGERKRLSLPGYPFARERYWIEAASSKQPVSNQPVAPAPEVGRVLAVPEWEASGADNVPDAEKINYARHHVLLCNLPRVAPEHPGIDATRVPIEAGQSLAERYLVAALACFDRVQAILQSRPKEKVLLQVAIGQVGEHAVLAGLVGLIRSARLESANLIAQLILTDEAVDERTFAQQLQSSQARPGEALLRYQGGTQQVQRWREQPWDSAPAVAFKDHGVYIITGGLGGLGVLFAQEILQSVPSARVILTGRSELSIDKQRVFDKLAGKFAKASGGIVYRRLDLERLDDVEQLIASVVKEFGALNGVIHSAGMTRDSLIVNKTTADFTSVLAPKVVGTLHLDLATKDIDLDFLALFSSASAALGNAGQADYAAANGFMDQFAHYRNTLTKAGARGGTTLSLNWPLWEEGGMQLGAKARALLLKASGMLPMSSKTGLQAFHRSFALATGQSLVLEGQLERLRHGLFPAAAAPRTKAQQVQTGAVPANQQVLAIKEAVAAELAQFKASRPRVSDPSQPSALSRLIQTVEATLKLPADKIDVDAHFESLGINSLILMELIANLDHEFDVTLTPAMFADVSTMSELAALLETLVPQTAADLPADMFEYVKQKYGVDLSQRKLESIDEIVAALVAERSGDLIDPAADASASSPSGSPSTGDIAIVGVSCRLPDAVDARSFWRNLLEGRNSVRELPKHRWNWEEYFSAAPMPGRTVSKWGALLEDVDCFDAGFFGMSPREAKGMDPQQRLLLQETYRAVEDAGISMRRLAGSNTGVFVGYQYAEYEQHLRKLGNQSMQDGPLFSSSSPSYYLANCVSFAFDLRGPSESINVNCASSAVAINRAYYSLVNRETDVAIAGGVSLNLFAGDYVASSQYGLLSSNGTSGVFDDDAKGFSRGEGVCAVVLKRLEDAQRDNDRIYAVIKSCHQNYRGAARSMSEVKHESITDVLSECYAKAGVEPQTVRYIEVDGYATKWADSFEYEGIKNALPSGVDGKYCALGSVKGNIGNTEAASGVTNLIKLALSLHHQQFPATVSKRKVSSFIDIDSAAHPLYIADQPIRFDEIRHDGQPIRAGINSFADSGTNVHILLEEYRQERQASSQSADTQQLFVLSAKDIRGLAAQVRQYLDFLSSPAPAESFTSLIHTLQTGREALDERLAIIARSRQELFGKLAAIEKTGLRAPLGLEAKDIYYGKTSALEKNPLAGLITAQMVQTQLVEARQSQQWKQIALLWTNGVAVPWEALWQREAAQRASLPGYPFAKDRHWIDGPAAKEPLVDSRAVSARALSNEPAAVTSALEEPAGLSPVGKMEWFLKQQVARELLLDAELIPLDKTMIELGVRSAGIVKLIHAIDTRLGTSLSPGVVFNYPQIGSLAAHLTETYADRIDSTVSPTTPVAEGRSQSTFIPLQPSGDKAPIFALTGAGASALSMQQLSHALGNDQPFYCLEAAGFDGDASPVTSVQEVAALNIAKLQALQAVGPYRLLGHSNGGVVAFEIARQLLEQGGSVSSLILLDSLCPTVRGPETIQSTVAVVFNHLMSLFGGGSPLTAKQLEQVPESELGEYLYRCAGSGFALTRAQFIAAFNAAIASERACRAYRPTRLPRKVDAILFRAGDSYQGVPSDYGWGSLLRTPLRVYEIAADHFSILDAGRVLEVARTIDLPATKPARKAVRVA